MGLLFVIHPENPQERLIRQAAQIVRSGGLIALPTESSYALCGHLGDADLVERIRRIRQVDERHHFTLMCRDLSQISTYARVDNVQFRMLKATTPGCYTFILQATKELPRRMLHPKRKTIGLRIPHHPVAQGLLKELDEPLVASTLILPGDDLPLCEGEEIQERLGRQLDLVIDSGGCGIGMTSVVDLSDGTPVVLRRGSGGLAPLGLE